MSEELEKSAGVSHPMVLIQAMIDKGTDPEAIKKWMDLCERWDANQAIRRFSEDMQATQQEMAVVVRDKKNPQKGNLYASLDEVSRMAKPVYTRHGFTLSFSEADTSKEGCVRVVCDVRHIGGHEKRFFGDYPMDGKGAKGGDVMNPLQGRVSSMTYAKRDLKCGIFDLTIADQDLDGEPQTRAIGPEEIRSINNLLDDCREAGLEVNYTKFLAWLTPRGQQPLENLEGVLMEDYRKAVDFCTKRLREAREANKAKGAE